MSTGSQEDLSRLTIDIPKKIHKRLKAMAAIQGKSMRKYISDLITQDMDKKIPNEETLKAIAAVEEGKDLVESKNAQELFDKLNI
ncbi:hypothetical protein ACFLYU_05460 [Candidatus Dependentiae bacterium]